MNLLLSWIKTITRALLYLLLLAGLALSGVLLALQFWFIPHIENYRENIAQAASVLTGQRITIGAIAAGWEKHHPHLVLDNVRLFNPNGQPALVLNRVETTLSWRSLTAAGVRLRTLEFKQPDLTIQRDAQGLLHVAGVTLSQHDADSGFTDWLLKQDSLVISDARIVWQDDQLSAPPLILNGVRLRIENRGDRHRFGLHALPPSALAAPLEIKGDFTGASFDPDDLRQWQGTLYAQLDYADLAAWRTWLPYPIEMQTGKGALRLWLTLDKAQIKDLTADVQLSEIRTRLRPDLPELELTTLDGRLGWKTLEQGFELSGAKLNVAAEGGLNLKQADFVLRLVRAENPGGEFQASALELAPLAALADRLPLDPELRQRLAGLSPQGIVSTLALQWKGELPRPASYDVKASFERLALKPYETWPGFNNLSGSIEGNQQSGQIHLEAKKIKLNFPKVFENTLQFDSFKTQAGWNTENRSTQFSINSMEFANAHLTGDLSGSYQVAGESSGVLDLNAHIAHAEVKQMHRYMPLQVPEKNREWLAAALLGGGFNDVQLQLRGNLADFPFADESKGLFQVSARAKGVALEYSQAWPKMEDINAEMQFRGKRVEIRGSSAQISGTQLAKVDAIIPELGNHDETLQIDIEALAPVENFLNFIAHSPVNSMLGGFTENMHGSGSGKLQLNLNIPLRQRQGTKVTGLYHFNDNQLSFGPGLLPLERVQGTLEFSETAVDASDLSAQVLGGPASINIATQRDRSVRVVARGKVNPDVLGDTPVSPLQPYLHGSAEWRATMIFGEKIHNILLESNLEGLAVQLPAPFGKVANGEMLLRYEKKSTSSGRERVWLSYGNAFSMQLLRRDSEAGYQRGNIVLGGRAGFPSKNGIWVSGVLMNFDFDQWSALLAQSVSGTYPQLAGIDLKLNTVDALGRHFGETRVTARQQNDNWKITLSGAEVSGEINWYPQDKGKLVARLATLTLPEPLPAKTATAQDKNTPVDFPALDIMVDNFNLAGKALGRLQLQAAQQGNDWRIENLQLTSPDSLLEVQGVWLNFSAVPQTRVNVKLGVSDIGAFMARLKLPEGIKGGSARLEGVLSWDGHPQQLDYATLSGNLQLNAAEGRFVKIEPGVAKLLGILSLQSLPRRALLDFSDIFSKGFAFDDIAADVTLDQGIAKTGNFKMRGPGATVSMSGEVDLARETQELKVKVTPGFVDSLALAGFLGGPIVGVTAFLVQKALKDPLGQLITTEYNVTGSWADPVITQLNAAPARSSVPQWQNQ
ncbi:MAG: YhdP family protein [Burkholderiales bacterium]